MGEIKPSETHGDPLARQVSLRLLVNCCIGVMLLTAAVCWLVMDFSNREILEFAARYPELMTVEAMLREQGEPSVKELNNTLLENGMIDGLLSGSGDPYLEYESVQEAAEAEVNQSMEDHQVGMTVSRLRGGTAILLEVQPEGQAAALGLRSGDQITAVDGAAVTSETYCQRIRSLLCKEGESRLLTVVRSGETLEISFSRTILEQPLPVSSAFYGSVAYVRVEVFDGLFGNTIPRALEEAKAESPSGLILDLRQNGGGSISTAVKLLDVFLTGGTEVFTLTPAEGEPVVYETESDDSWDVPIVILVDEKTASCSEIVSAALRDCCGATLLGTQTRGKGVYQDALPLEQGTLTFTLGRISTPKTPCWQDVGLTPDVMVSQDNSAMAEGALSLSEDAQLQEALALLEHP